MSRLDSPHRGEHVLLVESRILTAYLIKRELHPELAERYRDAHGALFVTPVSAADQALMAFIHRHPWSLPFLDAFVGVARPDSVLRKKLLIMTAILETTPLFTEYFLPSPFSRWAFAWQVMRIGIASVTKGLIGLILYPFALRGSTHAS